jgi:hypothetical protein
VLSNVERPSNATIYTEKCISKLEMKHVGCHSSHRSACSGPLHSRQGFWGRSIGGDAGLNAYFVDTLLWPSSAAGEQNNPSLRSELGIHSCKCLTSRKHSAGRQRLGSPGRGNRGLARASRKLSGRLENQSCDLQTLLFHL